jgi:hypothetical protein
MGREGVLAVPPKFIAPKLKGQMHFAPTFIGLSNNVENTAQTTGKLFT